MQTRLLFVALFSILALGCGEEDGGAPDIGTPDPDVPLCTAGQTQACDCPDGSTSTQACAADGASYGSCDCEVAPPPAAVPGDDPETSGHDAVGVVACGGLAVVVDGDEISGEGGPEAYVTDPVGCSNATDSCCVDGPNIGSDKGQGWDQGVRCVANSLTCPPGPTGNSTVRGECDGPEDCSDGQWCCINIGAQRVSCVTPDECMAVQGLHICHTDDQCDPGETCENSGPLFPWWASCE